MTTAYCFKNGYALLQQTHAVPANADLFVLAELPVSSPSHGTLWLEGTASVASVNSNVEGKTRDRPALTLEELVLCNVGTKLSLLVAQNGGGPIVPFGGGGGGAAAAAAVWYDGVVNVPGYQNDEALAGQQRHFTAQYVQLQPTDGSATLVFPLADVRQVRGATRFVFQERLDSKGLIVRLNAKPVATTLTIMMLTGGFTWAPSYKVQLLEGNTLSMAGHAAILNDTVAVREFTRCSLLAGVPNLAFSHVTDPLAQQEQVSEFLSALGSDNSASGYAAPPMYARARGRPNMMSNVMAQQMSYGGGGGGYGGADEAAAPAVDQNADDLHQYTFSNVACPKGSRVMFDMFPRITLGFCDVYQADTVDLRAHPQAEQSDVDVWHSIKLKNTSIVPWTTGPVLVTRGDDQSLVCQSKISYSPLGGEVNIKLTKALTVLVRHEESVEPTNKTKKVLDTNYLRFDATGSFALRNLKPTEVTLSLKVTLVGELASSTTPPTKNVEGASAGTDLANASRALSWDVVLKPKEDRLIKYSRFYWQRHN